jgi:hypothetical protein
MSKTSRAARLKHREAARTIPESTLREFIAREVPSLDGPGEWSEAQRDAVIGLYLAHQRYAGAWTCVHECGRPVRAFGDQCPACANLYGELGPVDWDSVGA